MTNTTTTEVSEMEEIKREMRAMQNDIKTLKEALNESTLKDIIVAGGMNGRQSLNSVEVFSWLKRAWAPLPPMTQCRSQASSFVNENGEMVVTGGRTKDECLQSIETMAIGEESSQWVTFPGKLPLKLHAHKSAVHKHRLVVAGGANDWKDKTYDYIFAVHLGQPASPKLLSRMQERIARHGMFLKEDKVFLFGGMSTNNIVIDNVVSYDLTGNEYEKMTKLPFPVCDMATVTWKDNVVLIGGTSQNDEVLNHVILYEIRTGESVMLPRMTSKRRGCTAVCTGNVIVAMGGWNEKTGFLNSVECFSFDRYCWEELPSMMEPRVCANAALKP